MKRNYLAHPNADTANALLDDQVYLDEDPTREGYKTDLFSIGNETYYRDYNIEIERKLSKKWKLRTSYIYQEYNIELIQNKVSPNVEAHIAVLEGLWNVTPKN